MTGYEHRTFSCRPVLSADSGDTFIALILDDGTDLATCAQGDWEILGQVYSTDSTRVEYLARRPL